MRIAQVSEVMPLELAPSAQRRLKCHRKRSALLKMIEAGTINPAFVITHRLPLQDAPEAYRTFRDKNVGCIKVVLKP
jgi:threonine dehydrogenase-like Zn-dependent dehydrogenase